MAVALAIALVWRSAWAPAAGALAGVAIALAGGRAELGDLERAARELWRPMVALVGGIVAYALLARCFRDVLDDEKPSIGRLQTAIPFGAPAQLVLVVTGASIASYPVLAGIGLPLWLVAAPSALACMLAARRG